MRHKETQRSIRVCRKTGTLDDKPLEEEGKTEKEEGKEEEEEENSRRINLILDHHMYTTFEPIVSNRGFSGLLFAM